MVDTGSDVGESLLQAFWRGGFHHPEVAKVRPADLLAHETYWHSHRVAVPNHGPKQLDRCVALRYTFTITRAGLPGATAELAMSAGSTRNRVCLPARSEASGLGRSRALVIANASGAQGENLASGAAGSRSQDERNGTRVRALLERESPVSAFGL